MHGVGFVKSLFIKWPTTCSCVEVMESLIVNWTEFRRTFVPERIMLFCRSLIWQLYLLTLPHITIGSSL
jgi:hypothetical protein